MSSTRACAVHLALCRVHRPAKALLSAAQPRISALLDALQAALRILLAGFQALLHLASVMRSGGGRREGTGLVRGGSSVRKQQVDGSKKSRPAHNTPHCPPPTPPHRPPCPRRCCSPPWQSGRRSWRRHAPCGGCASFVSCAVNRAALKEAKGKALTPPRLQQQRTPSPAHFSAPRRKLPASLSLVSLGVARYSAVSSAVPTATPPAVFRWRWC